jgi:iron complex outermembrane receptor protein
VTPQLTLTSISGYYKLHFLDADNFTQTANPAAIIAAAADYSTEEFSQEVRLQSSFEGSLNFVVGALYNTSKLYNQTLSHVNAAPPILAINLLNRQHGDAESVFGQLIWKPLDQFELTAGGRYSDETKSVRSYQRGLQVAVPTPKKSWNDFSPELTARWRPNDRTTVYASYKEGFLSGGFNASSVAPSFDPQNIKGFEGGVKAVLFDGTVRLQTAAYDYKVDGLQVTTLQQQNLGPVLVVSNAGKSTIKGAEFDSQWRTPLDGLTLRAAVGYNRARYQQYTAQCYKGQTVQLGCNLGRLPTGVFTLQDLKGFAIVRSPDWTVTLSSLFEREIAPGRTLTLSGDAAYTSKQQTQASYVPTGTLKEYWLVNASVGVRTDAGWEFALIGRNLTNEYYYTRSQERIGTGSGQGTAGPAQLADLYAGVSRGRELRVQVTKRFGPGL